MEHSGTAPPSGPRKIGILSSSIVTCACSFAAWLLSCPDITNELNSLSFRKILGLQTLENQTYLFCHFGVILLSFLLSFTFVVLDLRCHFLSFVICLSFYCNFGNGKMQKNSLRNDYHDRPFVTSWRHQIQGTSAETLGKPAGDEEDRAGELALGNSFLGLPGRGVVSQLGVQAWGEPAQKPGEGAGAGVKWPRGGGSGPGSGVDLETQKTQLYQHASHFFRIFFAFFSHFFRIFFAFPRLGVIFFAFLFAFPRLGVIFWALFCISQTGSHFLHFFAFPRPGLPPSPLAWSLWENDKKMNNARK